MYPWIVRRVRRITVIVAAATFFVLSSAGSLLDPQNSYAQGETFPDKSIQIICGLEPGSFLDVAARIVGGKVSKILNVPVVIVNRPGAHSKGALQTTARAKPDGYTLMTVNQANLVIDRIMNPADYPIDPEKDLTPIYEYGAMPSYATFNVSAPWNTLKEFLDDAKANPNKFTVATTGAGSTSNFILEILCQQSGAKIKHVPFKGGTVLVTQILGGHVTAVFTGNPPLLSNIEAGHLKAFAIFADDRNPRFPNLPSIVELGYPDASLPVWAGFVGPARLPGAVQKKLVSAFEKAIQDPEVVAALRNIGILVKPKGPEEMRNRIRTQYGFLLNFAKKANIVK